MRGLTSRFFMRGLTVFGARFHALVAPFMNVDLARVEVPDSI